MNKNKINQEMQLAYEALEKTGIANEKGEIEKNFRGQISSFGAAITMGSLLAAIAFFSKDASAEVSRSKLLDAILYVLKKQGTVKEKTTSLFDYAREYVEQGMEAVCREEIINAAIAIKLAMNLYILEEK